MESSTDCAEVKRGDADLCYPGREEVASLWRAARDVTLDGGVWEWLLSRGIGRSVSQLDLARALPEGELPLWGQHWARGGWRLLIPLYDAAGEMRSFMARRVTAGDGPKSLPPSSRGLEHKLRVKRLAFVSPPALVGVRKEGLSSCVIAEGEPDYLTWAAKGGRVIGVRSGTWSDDWAAHFHDGALVMIRTDQDYAGHKYATEVGRSLPWADLRRLAPQDPPGDDNDRLMRGLLDADPRVGCVPYKPPPVEQRRLDIGGRVDPGSAPDRERKYAEAALRGECDRVTSAPEHGVNETLNRAAFAAGRLCKGSGAPLSRIEVEQALHDAARARGHAENPTKATVKSGLDAASDWPGLPADDRPTHERRLDKRAASRRQAREDHDHEPPPRDWREDLLRAMRGNVKACQTNVSTILHHDPEWRDVLAYDEMKARVIIMRRPPWGQYERHPGEFVEGREWSTDEDNRLRQWLARSYGFEPKLADQAAAVLIEAQRRPINPVRDYLRGLKWDGKHRVNTWLRDFCSVDDSPYSRNVGRWWLISAVARAMLPGVKADHVLILEGPQGFMKSTALRSLCADPDWFSDTEPSIGSKDAFLAIKGKWILELAELDGVTSKRESGALKAYVSSASDSYRPPYGARNVDVRRGCVFAATVNKDRYLHDETGNRRWWPVRCRRPCDIRGIRRDRDQIWAEALELFSRGAPHYPSTDEDHNLCREEQSMRYVGDPWEHHIVRWIAEHPKDWITTATLLSNALAVDRDKQTQQHMKRVVAILTSLGYSTQRPRDDDGRRITVWALRN